jgi:hypothetical protein
MYGADGQPQQITGTTQFSMPNSKQRAMYALRIIWGIPDTSQAAAVLGRKGGGSTSESKSAASRINGKLGGRPRNNAIPSKGGFIV